LSKVNVCFQRHPPWAKDIVKNLWMVTYVQLHCWEMLAA